MLSRSVAEAVDPLESFTVNCGLVLDVAAGVPLSDPPTLKAIPFGKPVADHV
jgi:hypothetical protein